MLKFLIVFSLTLTLSAGEPYLGQKPPGAEPELFAPGIISTGLSEREPSFSPDGKHCYYFVILQNYTTILVSHQTENGWTKPEVAPFAGAYADFEPCFSPDGSSLLFCSNRPNPQKTSMANDIDIWIMPAQNSGWGEPKPLPAVINSAAIEFFPSLTRNGTLYFGRAAADFSRVDVYRSVLEEGEYRTVEKLPQVINQPNHPADNAFIDPDERYLLYPLHRADGTSGFQVSYRDEIGNWTTPIDLGPAFNSSQQQEGARVSPDGAYIFFSATRSQSQGLGFFERPRSIADVPRLSRSHLEGVQYGPGNGQRDIYWVSAEVLMQRAPNAPKRPDHKP